MIRKLVVVDAKGHLLGRMASYVAKQLELGQKIVIVRCESALISGKLYRSKLNFMEYLNKRTNFNPTHGPIHQKSPAQIVFKCIKGMLNYKTARGAAALARLKCFNGCPLSMNCKKKMVIPDALKAARLAPRARFGVLGEVAKECGWTKKELLQEEEAKRLTKNHEWYVKKVENDKKAKATIKSNAEIQKINKELEQYGY